MPTPVAVAAYQYLMQHNAWYKRFVVMQRERLSDGASLHTSSYDLFINFTGVEAAMYPVLYPSTEFTDTGILASYKDKYEDDTNRVLSIGISWTRKVLSSVRVYGEHRDLSFFLYEKHLANKFFAAHVRAQKMGITADVLTRDSQTSTGYWDIVQDSLADLVRIMLARCFDAEGHRALYDHVRGLRGEVWLCAYPNVFITIAPAEWKFPRPYWLDPYLKVIFAGAYIMSLHMYYLVGCIWGFLSNAWGHRWFVVYEWVKKTEYQGRGTPHWHIAAWVVCFGILRSLQGRTGTAVVSGFVSFLQLLFHCEIDVQIGNGRLNYINGYVAKDHDAVDVGLGEYVQKGATAPWLASYRLLSKSSPCLPEVAIRMSQLSEFERSYSHVLLYPPQPGAMASVQGRQANFSSKMYGFYVEEMRSGLGSGKPISEVFLQWHRLRRYDAEKKVAEYRGTVCQHGRAKTMVVACRYWYELTDGFWGQLVLTQIPHARPEDLVPQCTKHLESMQNFAGMIEYLMSWVWESKDIIVAREGVRFQVSCLPLVVGHDGRLVAVGEYRAGGAVFSSERGAFEYLSLVASRELQYRGMRDNRVQNFEYKQEAHFLLYRKVASCRDEVEYERLRQAWDVLNRPQYRDRVWAPAQERALERIREGLSHEDEETRAASHRWLYIAGPPGSGKSAVLIEAAVQAAKAGMKVTIICPTGTLVHAYKSLLPHCDGIENVSVDTIHGVLKYKRPGADEKVVWAPPSALRSKDLILIDEGSQYDDQEMQRLFQSIQEQPHKPFTCIVADMQQLQPMVSGVFVRALVATLQSISLETVYRSKDGVHLEFLNRIRWKQPSRVLLEEYFEGRNPRGSLDAAVGRGIDISRETGQPFLWLCSTNRGAAEVSAAAVRCVGITEVELRKGFLPDPTSKSGHRIVARPGVLVRLTRNEDKTRGFVNGAIAAVVESLRGNAVFSARLVESGNMVMVSPMEEDGQVFLPCCYGYATTIRRVQGASLSYGCLYFDQKYHHAGRGYGYVGASRFRERAGLYLYGKIRRTDFLPVGDEQEDEVLERGYLSVSSDDEDGDGLAKVYEGREEDSESDAYGEVEANDDDFQ